MQYTIVNNTSKLQYKLIVLHNKAILLFHSVHSLASKCNLKVLGRSPSELRQ